MPDWSYQTVFRPLLFRLPYESARDLACGFLGGLARLPLGTAVIDFLGHMRPDPRLRTQAGGLSLPSPVLLGPWLDVRGLALPALARFGFGAIELGTLGVAPSRGDCLKRSDAEQSLVTAGTLPQLALADLLKRWPAQTDLPVIVRLSSGYLSESASVAAAWEAVAEQIVPRAAAIALEIDAEAIRSLTPVQLTTRIEVITAAANSSAKHAAAANVRRSVFISLPADSDISAFEPFLTAAIDAGCTGFIVDGRIACAAGGWLIGAAAFSHSLQTNYDLRRSFGDEPTIISGGAASPAAALELLAAGADVVQIDAALVYAGPGLPKRINEGVLALSTQLGRRDALNPAAMLPPERAANASRLAWFWCLALGAAMLLGGLLALAFSATRVVLPYDEAYLGMSAGELESRIPRLLEFMRHDRVTLAGTMLAVGIQFSFLSWFGIRRGMHWAKVAVVSAAFSGFLTFFLFLGFGYFDPFHAFVTAILFQFLLLAFQGQLAAATPPRLPNLTSDWRWQLANWGQLLLVVQGIAVLTAGLTISYIGITAVFVREDLEFLQMTRAAIEAANPRLIPVVAHDRASFGGMLICVGLTTLLTALWGIRQGKSWLWWMLALAGTIGYGTTLWVHLIVHYTDPMHLAPAVGGLALLWAALSLLYPFLAMPNRAQEAEWNKLLAGFRRSGKFDEVPRRGHTAIASSKLE